jgi:hypothetical protein
VVSLLRLGNEETELKKRSRSAANARRKLAAMREAHLAKLGR